MNMMARSFTSTLSARLWTPSDASRGAGHYHKTIDSRANIRRARNNPEPLVTAASGHELSHWESSKAASRASPAPGSSVSRRGGSRASGRGGAGGGAVSARERRQLAAIRELVNSSMAALEARIEERLVYPVGS
ncbi:hypothetical protein G3M48_005155 [Beauveria asiatica]|uniref:Uncharacterized protein n=1 Tax=Beauveria asiatica TaxID=1069075 RepID=A0AAW0RS88_9HYPO